MFVIDIQQLNFIRFIFIRLKLVAIVITAIVSPPIIRVAHFALYLHEINHLSDVI